MFNLLKGSTTLIEFSKEFSFEMQFQFLESIAEVLLAVSTDQGGCFD